MKFCLIMLFVLGMPLKASLPNLESDQMSLMESKYSFWFKGNPVAADKQFKKLNVIDAEAAWHAVDMLVSQSKKQEALELLLKTIPHSLGQEKQALIDRVFFIKPAYKLPIVKNNRVSLCVSYVKDNRTQLWTIKMGVPLRLEENSAGQLVSLKIDKMFSAGLMAKKLGFSVGDRIFSLNGKAVADWAKFEVLPFLIRSNVAGTEIKIELIPKGKNKKIEKVFHIMSDAELVNMHMKMK